MLKRKSREKKKKVKLPIKEIIKAEIPSAIASRIVPMSNLGLAAVVLSVGILFVRTLRSLSPFLAIFGLLLLGYSLWQKRDVLVRGYDEYLFKVVDYTYFTPIERKMNRPTGVELLNRTPGIDEDSRVYHIATSGKKTLPPVDWIIRVYVPKGTVPAEYGGRKYFPTVYGYKLENDDRGE